MASLLHRDALAILLWAANTVSYRLHNLNAATTTERTPTYSDWRQQAAEVQGGGCGDHQSVRVTGAEGIASAAAFLNTQPLE
jgi:hypothetical protein